MVDQLGDTDGFLDPEDAPVHLGQIGTVASSGDGAPITVLGVGLSEAVLQRLADSGEYRVVEGVASGEPPDIALVSTRLPRAELMSRMSSLRDLCPLIVIAHTGGERLAVDVIRAGGVGVIAEGNEGALSAYLHAVAHDTGLLDVYERQLGQQRARAEVRRSQDPVTGLPTRSSFEARLADATLSGDIPRIGYIRILHLEGRDPGASREVLRLVRKRLALQFTAIARAFDVELFSLDIAEFGLLGPTLSPNRALQLGLRLARIAQDFSPNGAPLALALGHAGSEVSSDPSVVRQLAERAAEVAAQEQRSNVVAADTLALGVSSTTELEAALHVLAYVEERCAFPGYGEQVAEVAAELAWELGFEGPARTTIQLAAHLHAIGKGSLPADAMADDDALTAELLDAHRTYPVRGEDYLRPLAGADVAAAVRWHRERWDGGGFPDGLRGEDIPISARIIAIARAFAGEGAKDSTQAVNRLLAEAGGSLDPALVEIVAPLLARRVALAVVPA